MQRQQEARSQVPTGLGQKLARGPQGWSRSQPAASLWSDSAFILYSWRDGQPEASPQTIGFTKPEFGLHLGPVRRQGFLSHEED